MSSFEYWLSMFEPLAWTLILGGFAIGGMFVAGGVVSTTWFREDGALVGMFAAFLLIKFYIHLRYDKRLSKPFLQENRG